MLVEPALRTTLGTRGPLALKPTSLGMQTLHIGDAENLPRRKA